MLAQQAGGGVCAGPHQEVRGGLWKKGDLGGRCFFGKGACRGGDGGLESGVRIAYSVLPPRPHTLRGWYRPCIVPRERLLLPLASATLNTPLPPSCSQSTLKFLSQRAMSELHLGSVAEASPRLAKWWSGVTSLRQEWQVSALMVGCDLPEAGVAGERTEQGGGGEHPSSSPPHPIPRAHPPPP